MKNKAPPLQRRQLLQNAANFLYDSITPLDPAGISDISHQQELQKVGQSASPRDMLGGRKMYNFDNASHQLQTGQFDYGHSSETLPTQRFRAFRASSVASRLARCQLSFLVIPSLVTPEPKPLMPTDSVPEWRRALKLFCWAERAIRPSSVFSSMR